MKYSKSEYPEKMKKLPANVRNKAIEILNAMLIADTKLDLKYATALSIKRAKDWVNKNKKHTSHSAAKYYVIPYKSGWGVKSDLKSPVTYFFNRLDRTIEAARYMAFKNHADLVITRKNGKVEKIVK